MTRPPFPPFTEATARAKVQAAEDAWNTCDPQRVALGYTKDSQWRNRATFLNGHTEIIEFLKAKWITEQEYRLSKELWAFTDNRIAVRFKYEWRDSRDAWWRSYGNEMWEFNAQGLTHSRFASINDVAIDKTERELFAPAAPERDR